MKLIEFLKEITTNPDWDKSNILWDTAIEIAEQRGAIGIEDIIDWHEVWPALGNLIQFIERGVFDDYKENKIKMKEYTICKHYIKDAYPCESAYIGDNADCIYHSLYTICPYMDAYEGELEIA